ALPPTTAVDFPNEVLGHIYSSLADIEYHLASGASERLQLGGMVGAFAYARAMMVE
ncbi:replication factor c subunit 5, partial [Nannochloropsis oceanica]